MKRRNFILIMILTFTMLISFSFVAHSQLKIPGQIGSRTGYTIESNIFTLNTSSTLYISNSYLRTFSTITSGIVPASSATYSTTTFLRSDGTWTTPVSGATYTLFSYTNSGLTPSSSATYSTTTFLRSDGTWTIPLPENCGGNANHTACWKSDGITLGYCSSVVASDGTCTCN